MKSLDQILGKSGLTFIGDPFECECGEMVQEVQLTIIGGPNKGKPYRSKKGCKCEDKALANQAVEIRKKQMLNRLHEIFDENSILNPKLQKATFDNYHQSFSHSAFTMKTVGLEYVEQFSRDNPKNLMFYGKPQIGKSHLAIAIVKALMEKGYSALFINVPKLLSKIKSTYNKKSDTTEDEILRMLASMDLLVIDDLGAEKNEDQKAKAWSDSLLWQIIDDRQGKHTIYTSNLTDVGLQEFYDERTYKRMMNGTEKYVMRG